MTLRADEDAQVHALTVAASVAVAAAKDQALSISGGGAASLNSILSRANAAVTESTVAALGPLTLEAGQHSVIEATVVSVALGIGAGGSNGLAAAIGVAVARNFIGYDESGQLPTGGKASQIRAYVDHSTIASGALSATATANQTITAVTVSVSVAIAAAGDNALGLGGSGVFTQNQIRTEIRASIDGAGPGGVRPTSISLEATDSSEISASAGAAAVAASFATNALAVSIGVALAHNRIENTIEASITNVPLDLTGAVTLEARESASISATSVAASLAVGAGFGGGGVAASGAGAESTNVLLTNTNAFVRGGSVKTPGDLTVRASLAGSITATVVAASLAVGGGSSTGVGVAVGIAVARNFIGWDPDAIALTPIHSGNHVSVATLIPGETVRIDSGPLAGDVYKYIGPTIVDGDTVTSGRQPIDLSVQNYGDTSRWQLVNAQRSPAVVQAFVQGSPLTITGDVTVTASSDATIQAVIVAVAAAISGGGNAGVSVSGAGVYAENKIATFVQAYVASSSLQFVSARSFTIVAHDSSRIQTVGVGASLAAAFGGDTAGVAVSIGLAIAFNEVDAEVAAYVDGVVLTTTGGDVDIEATTQGGDLFDLTDSSITADMLDDASATDAANTTDVVGDSVTLRALELNFKANGQPLTAGKYSTTQTLPPVFDTLLGKRDLVRGDTVLVKAGYDPAKGVAGTVYVFDGAVTELGVDLGNENYLDTNRWKVGLWVPLKHGDVVRVTSSGLSYQYQGADATRLVNLVTQSYDGTIFWKYQPPALVSIKPGELWQLMSGTDTYLITKVVSGSTTTFVVSRPTIGAVAVAASFAASFGGQAGVAVAGAGAFARNSILGKTNAYVTGSSITSARDVVLHATSTNSISATVVGASLALGGGGAVGVGVSIGVGISENSIGSYDVNGNREPVEVRAYVEDSAVSAVRELEQTALAEQTITAVVVAASGAVGGGGTVGVGASGAGSTATNTIVVDVKATIEGEGSPAFAIHGVSAQQVTLAATDISRIKTIAIGASLAVGGGGGVGGALSIGVSLASNRIDDVIEASISGVSSGVTSAGDIALAATSTASIDSLAVAASIAVGGGGGSGLALTGAGAAALNAITNRVLAYADATSLKTTGTAATPGNVTIEAADVSGISAIVAGISVAVGGGGVGGIGVSIGASVAQNRIGPAYDYTSDEFVDPDTAADAGVGIGGGTLVRVALTHTAGGAPGAIYKYRGLPGNVKLSTQNYADSNRWTKLTDTASHAVLAYLHDTSVSAHGELTIEAAADGAISAVTAAGSAAVAGAGVFSLAASGAGSSATNQMTAQVAAYIDGDGTGISAAAVDVSATDTASITAVNVAASMSVSVAPIGAAVAIGVVLAKDVVANDVQAYIADAGHHVKSAGALSISAVSQSSPVLDADGNPFVLTGFTPSQLDAGNPFTALFVAAALPSSAPVKGTLTLFTIQPGKSWELVASLGTAYVIRLDAATNKLFVSRATISAQTVTAAVSVSGVALSAAGANALNAYSTRTRAWIGEGSTVDAGGAVSVSASDTSSIAAFLTGAAISAGGIAAANTSTVTSNIITSEVEASIGSATVSSTAGGVTVSATSELTVLSATLSVAIGFGTVGGAVSVAVARTFIGGHTSASIGGATVTATAGHVDVAAASTLVANAQMRNGSGGSAFGITASDGKTTVTHDTTATVGAGAVFDVGSLGVHAATTGSGVSTLDSGSGGAVSVAAGGATTVLEGTVQASIDTASINATGDVDVTAMSATFARATAGAGSGGVFSVATVTVVARDVVVTKAFVGDGVMIGDFSNPAAPVGIGGNVVVTALGRAEADASGDASGGGVVHVGSPQATAELAPSVEARIGGPSRSTVVLTKGSVEVHAELTKAAPPGGDGKTTATATGGEGGIGAFGFPSAKVTGATVDGKVVGPTVTALLAASRLEADGNVELDASSAFLVTATADTAGGGAAQVGHATASVDLGRSPTTAAVATSTVVRAGRDATIDASNDHTIFASATAVGGAPFLSVNIADSSALLDNDVQVDVGGAASVEAGGSLKLHVVSGTSIVTSSETGAFAVAAGADSNLSARPRGVQLGSASDPAERSVRIGAGAALNANTVDVLAKTSRLVLQAEAVAKSVESASSNAVVDANIDTFVHVIGGSASRRTVITGAQGVDLEARNGGQPGDALVIRRTSSAGAIVPVAETNGIDALSAFVRTDALATVSAGARSGGSPGLLASPSDLQLALYVTGVNGPIAVETDSEVGVLTALHGSQRDALIEWDADVVVLGGVHGSPFLEVGTDGKVLAVNNVQLIDGFTGVVYTPRVGDSVDHDNVGYYTVADIGNRGYADILFETAENDGRISLTSPAIKNRHANGVDKPWPVFDIRDTLPSVTIIDHSNLTMRLKKIDVVNEVAATGTSSSSDSATVKLDPGFGSAVPPIPILFLPTRATIEFDLRSSAAPTVVDIQKLGAGDVVLTGTINNPIGTTHIRDTIGDIRSSGGLLVTHVLNVEATTGSIGAGSSGLTVELVRFEERPRVDGPASPQLRTPGLSAFAGLDVNLSYRGLDRAPGAGPFTISIDVSAGRNKNLIALPTVSETGTPVSFGVKAIVLKEVASPSWAPPGITIHTHFRPESDDASASHDTAVFGQRFATTSGIVFAAIEGSLFSGVVAYFTAADASAVPGDFTASIDWGDGVTTLVATVKDAGETFSVSGAHIFFDEGIYVVRVKVTRTDGSGDPVFVESSANVANAPLRATLLAPTSLIVGTAASVTLTFRDGNPFSLAPDFTVTIDWERTQTRSRMAPRWFYHQDENSVLRRFLTASGSHIYTTAGTFEVEAVVDEGGNRAAAASRFIRVFAPIVASGTAV